MAMRLKIHTLLRFQFSYYLMAMAYLLMSYLAISRGKPALSTADPVASSIVLTAYCVFLLSGLFNTRTFYRILMGISVIGFGYGGVIHHFVNYFQSGLEGYSSFTTWSVAIAINAYGGVFNFLAASGKYVT